MSKSIDVFSMRKRRSLGAEKSEYAFQLRRSRSHDRQVHEKTLNFLSWHAFATILTLSARFGESDSGESVESRT